MIFKAGKYPQGDWPKERVRKLAESYDPEKSWEAPAVIGHRYYTGTDESQFAHGWVKSLRMDGSGKVWADIPEFSADAKKALAENKLRYVSAEIIEYDKDDAGQAPYLRAVALLGRDSPQIPAARLPSLFEVLTQGTVTVLDEKERVAAFTRKVNAKEIETLSFGRGEPGGGAPRPENQEVSGMDETEKLKAELAAKDAEIAAFKKENEDLKNSGKKQESLVFFGKLRDEGKIPPALAEQAADLDARLGEEERKNYRALFSRLEQRVDLSGTHIADKKNAPVSPAGTEDRLAAKIRAFQKEKNFASFSEAADALYAEKPELFAETEGGEA
jgi:hypothetical protein